MTDKQTQKAGDHSQQVQIGTVFMGIDEKRVREVVGEMLALALKDFSTDAVIIATQRIQVFGEILIPKMVQEKALEAFADPAFQILLVDAQKSAASTEKEADYELLSELMIHRFKKGSSRVVRASTSRAVEIVDQISDEALLGVTAYHSVTYFAPTTGDLPAGLVALDELFGKIIYDTLPVGSGWLDHLDILDAVRLSSAVIIRMNSLDDYWLEIFDGLVKKGIKKDAETYNQAKKFLKEAGLNESCLIENSIDTEYLKINVSSKAQISKLSMNDIYQGKRLINLKEQEALEQIYDLYDNVKISKTDFASEIEKYPNLKKLRDWWNSLNNQPFQITSVGRVLAHANAQRIDNSLPDLD